MQPAFRKPAVSFCPLVEILYVLRTGRLLTGPDDSLRICNETISVLPNPSLASCDAFFIAGCIRIDQLPTVFLIQSADQIDHRLGIIFLCRNAYRVILYEAAEAFYYNDDVIFYFTPEDLDHTPHLQRNIVGEGLFPFFSGFYFVFVRRVFRKLLLYNDVELVLVHRIRPAYIYVSGSMLASDPDHLIRPAG